MCWVVRKAPYHMFPCSALFSTSGYLFVIGDCNLHLNVSIPEYSPEITNILEPFVFEWTAHYGGSISAEHGIGFKKTQYLHLSKTAESIEVMRQLKQVFDPKGILNPYKVLPDV